MKKMSFGKYLEVMIGSGDPDMIRKHVHHILFKTGNGKKQRRLVKECNSYDDIARILES